MELWFFISRFWLFSCNSEKKSEFLQFQILYHTIEICIYISQFFILLHLTVSCFHNRMKIKCDFLAHISDIFSHICKLIFHNAYFFLRIANLKLTFLSLYLTIMTSCCLGIGKIVLRTIHTAQANGNKLVVLELVCWRLLDQCVTPVGVCWRLFSSDWTCLIGICWVVKCLSGVKWFSNKLQQTLTWPRTVSMTMRIFHLKGASPMASFISFAIFSGEEWRTKILITVQFWLWLQDHQFRSQSDLHHPDASGAMRHDKIQERFYWLLSVTLSARCDNGHIRCRHGVTWLSVTRSLLGQCEHYSYFFIKF